MSQFRKSSKLDNVCYDIRGPLLDEAMRLEEEGHQILKLNTGNPAPFGLMAPDEILKDMIMNLPHTQGYSNSKGLFSARKAVMQYYQQRGIRNVEIGDIFLGNGASELIQMSMNALLDSGDEILIPAPDYPLWTASVNLSGGTAVHYLCNEESEWMPDIEDIKRKITPNTRGIVIINPNNPTGAVYSRDVLKKIVEIAEEHKLILFSDEIYEKILYDDRTHIHTASLTETIPIITFGGLSKAYRVAGFRVGWMMIGGNKGMITDYIEGLTMLAGMRLCSNVPGQSIIQTALGGYQSINEYIVPGGRLHEQRDFIYERVNSIPGLSCTKPQGAFYAFVKTDCQKFNITDDKIFALDLLRATKILIVQGTGFNWPKPDHFRLVFLPNMTDLTDIFNKMEDFLKTYRQAD
jgi:alanine-synthesizing transaminase